MLTKGLSESLRVECKEFRLKGFSYTAKNISEYQKHNVNLTKLICECQTWSVIFVNSEHLATKEWEKIMGHPTFLRNLILFDLEEAYLI
ncbi:atp-dependent dna helicase [Moniliophthora roreri MCA 2997]|uniref:Atp-dependent dna helicase n=1 Tax=Moniliophthora roreri (strain MCA 2997) TaxID=1381753 RepID=V2WQF6_MONRO|nr:atp-dependent dna helicase [Moniliophthora roreri MCA 2997]